VFFLIWLTGCAQGGLRAPTGTSCKTELLFESQSTKLCVHGLTLFDAMKKIILSLICLATAAPLFADGTNSLPDEKSRVSYSIGMMLGNNYFKRQNLDASVVDINVVTEAIKAVMAGGPMLLTDEEAQTTLRAFGQEYAAKVAKKAKADGEAFLAANKNNPGVQTLPDGLQYQVITNGTGALPAASDVVTVNYRGTLVDGTEFDSSYKRGQPATFPVGGVIPGWTEALKMMKVGSKWKLFIPAELAYGERGQRGIPPNSALIFEVELLGTKTPPAPAPAAPLTSDIIKVPSKAEMDKGAKVEIIKPEDAQKAAAQASH
jgi:FKBP-type peptidyl-prolyl cis-trans isomerase